MSAAPAMETFAWRIAGHLTHRWPALGIAACWLATRDTHDFRDLREPSPSELRELRGVMAWYAFRMEGFGRESARVMLMLAEVAADGQADPGAS